MCNQKRFRNFWSYVRRRFDLLSRNFCLKSIFYETPTPNHFTFPDLKGFVSPIPHTYITGPVLNNKKHHADRNSIRISFIIYKFFSFLLLLPSGQRFYFVFGRSQFQVGQGFRGFSRYHQTNVGQYLKSGHSHFPSFSFPIH